MFQPYNLWWSPDLKIYMNSVEASTVTDISDLITVQHEC